MANLFDRIRLLFHKDKELYSSLYRILGFCPRDISLYRQAMAHSSSDLRGGDGRRIDNERLEFLGDAIIEAVTSDIVFRHFGRKDEGFLTTTRSKLVQRSALNRLAEDVGLTGLVRSDGRSTGRNSHIMGNAFEALVGAIYLDRGYAYSMRFLKRMIIAGRLDLDKVARKEVDFKSKLLEWAQKNRMETEFRLDGRTRSEGVPAFRTRVTIEGVVCGSGGGHSKKESQQKASREALRRIRKEKGLLDTLLQAKSARAAAGEGKPPARDAAAGGASKPAAEAGTETAAAKEGSAA